MKRVMPTAAVLLAMSTSTAVAAPGDTVLVSRARGGDAFGALNPSFSADGRYVAFETEAGGLVAHRGHSVGDVFVKDLETGKLVLVSRANGRNGHFADEDGSGDAAISPDGNFVAFDGSRDLDPAAPEDTTPIYLRDIRRGRLLLVSRATGARGAVQNYASYKPEVSRDGRFVAYSSEASNLDPADRNHREDAYVRDVRRNRTLLVSRASGARGERGDGVSTDISISDDGRYVAFVSRAANLDPDDPDHQRDVFVRDLVANRTVLVSRHDVSGQATAPSISADGRFVAYVFRGMVYLTDLESGATVLVSDAGDLPSVSADGRHVSFESKDADGNINVYVRDLDAATATLVSPTAPAAPATEEFDYAGSSSITPDGRFVVFETNHDASPADDDHDVDVYRRELGRP